MGFDGLHHRERLYAQKNTSCVQVSLDLDSLDILLKKESSK